MNYEWGNQQTHIWKRTETFTSIPWVQIQNRWEEEKIFTKIQLSDMQKCKLKEHRNTNNRNTKMQIKEIQNLRLHKFKWQKNKYHKFRNTNHRNTYIQIT